MDVVLVLLYFEKTLKQRMMTQKQQEEAAIAERISKLNLSKEVRDGMTPIIDSDVAHMKNLDPAKLDPQFVNIKNRDQAEVDKIAA